MEELILAYDFGTSGVKAILIDREGHVLSTSEEAYPLFNPEPLYVEQSTDDYWNAVCHVTRKVMETAGRSPEQVKGMSFSVQAYNTIPVDKEGNVLHSAISWLDGRAQEEAEAINHACGAELVRSQDFQCRMMWVKNKLPEIYEKTYAFLDCSGFLQYKCTGVMFVDKDYDGIVRHNPVIQEYLDATVAAAGIDQAKLPPFVEPCRVYGLTDKRGAADLGLREGIPVFGGMSDVPAAAAGCACTKEGEAHLYLGTSGWLSALIREPVAGAPGSYLISSINPELLIYGGCTNSCCKMLNWTIDRFFAREHEELGADIFSYINEEVEKIDPGCDGLYAAPWLFGEQFPVCDANARAMFFNIREDHSRMHFIEAAMESICFSMKWQIELFMKDTGKSLDEIAVNGGGSLSDHWMQMMADITGLVVNVPQETCHSGAIGAGIAAAIGLGWCGFDDAGTFIKFDKTFFPRKEYKELYEEKYGRFKELYAISKEIFKKLNG